MFACLSLVREYFFAAIIYFHFNDLSTSSRKHSEGMLIAG